jgi:putative glycosyltransferase (TIGR04372 family)
MPAAILMVIVIRIIRPLVFVRFGYFTVDRIGHFSFDIEHYLSERRLNQGGRKTLDLFFFSGKPSNKQLSKMCLRILNVHPVVELFYLANNIVPWGRKHKILPERIETDSRDLKGIFSKVGTQIGFNLDEDQIGEEYVQGLGLDASSRFVCVMVRDSSYLESIDGERDWSYHDFRDTDIETYEGAINFLIERGYWVFRMGKAVRKEFTVNHPRFVDYANSSNRCDFLDIWLVANCYFSISTGLGLDSIADVFRKPIVLVNYLPILDMEAWGSFITVPKGLIWERNQESLTLKEQLHHTSLNGHYYRSNGIQVTDLDSTEITEAVMEMEERLSGSWEETEEDRLLQEKFWSELSSWSDYSKYHGWIHPEGRLGAHYLRRSKHWFFN